GLQAEILELKANPSRPAEGTVIEAKLDRGRGPVATVLVQRGTLRPGDIVVAGAEWGRVRALVSDSGLSVIAAGPSTPVDVLGFNVRANKEAREAAERAGIEIRYYNIIYNLVDDVKKAMSGLLAPTLRETLLGNATILEIFKVSKVGNIAGCRVTDGTVERGANVRLVRDNVVIHEGKLSQLKRFKDDAKEVLAGQECGMAFENYQDMKVGDTIECYRVEQV